MTTVEGGEIVRVGKGRTSWLVQSVVGESAVLYSGRSTRSAPVADLVVVPAPAERVDPASPKDLARRFGLRLYRVPDLEEQVLHLPNQRILLVSEGVSDCRLREAIHTVRKKGDCR